MVQKEGILHWWIRPVLGLNHKVITEDENGNEKSSVHYKGRLVVNCLETMPLDNVSRQCL